MDGPAHGVRNLRGRKKGRVVGSVNEEMAPKKGALEKRPATAASLVAIVKPLPRPFETWLTGLRDDTIVEPADDGTELKRARRAGLDANEGRNDEVEVVGAPLIHLGDAPVTDERVLRHSLDHAGAGLTVGVSGERAKRSEVRCTPG